MQGPSWAREGAGGTPDPVAAPRFSVSNDLKYDAERDLRDIEAPGIAVHALSKVSWQPGVAGAAQGCPAVPPRRG